jgi:hypothetical protein
MYRLVGILLGLVAIKSLHHSASVVAVAAHANFGEIITNMSTDDAVGAMKTEQRNLEQCPSKNSCRLLGFQGVSLHKLGKYGIFCVQGCLMAPS